MTASPSTPFTVDRALVRELKNREDTVFRDRHPRSFALRDVWEAIVGAGPVCSVPATDADVDAYLEGWTSLLASISR